jgi:hypothetical protein
MRLRWQDVEGDDVGGEWKTLDLRLETDGAPELRPGLHMQAAPPRLMRLVAGEWPLVWARVEAEHYGYWYLRRPLAENSPGLVLPRITAPEARAVDAPFGSQQWFRSWARTFAQKLLSSPVSPLHPGRWWLAPGEVRESDAGGLPTAAGPPSVCFLDRLAAQPSAGYTEWDFGDALEPLAMRPMSGSDDARVKAWRRALREGYAPPALLMWVSGLDRYVVLDGHDRIAAALAEGTLPKVLVLCHLQEHGRIPDPLRRSVITDVVARQLEASRAPDLRPNRPFRVETANRLLIESFDDRPHLAPVSRAWPLEGGARLWRSQVSEALSEVADDDVRRGLLSAD